MRLFKVIASLMFAGLIALSLVACASQQSSANAESDEYGVTVVFQNQSGWHTKDINVDNDNVYSDKATAEYSVDGCWVIVVDSRMIYLEYDNAAEKKAGLAHVKLFTE